MAMGMAVKAQVMGAWAAKNWHIGLWAGHRVLMDKTHGATGGQHLWWWERTSGVGGDCKGLADEAIRSGTMRLQWVGEQPNLDLKSTKFAIANNGVQNETQGKQLQKMQLSQSAKVLSVFWVVSQVTSHNQGGENVKTQNIHF